MTSDQDKTAAAEPDIRRLLHELQVQKIELELQNTELQRTNKELENRSIHLRTLLETLPDFVWLKDEQGRYLACNHRFETYFGVPEADIIGKTDYDFVAPELADFFRQHDMKAIAAGCPVINEESITLPDGSTELLETIKTPMYGQDGLLTGVLGVARNITQLRQAHDELQASEEQYRRLFTEMMSAMLLAEVLFDEAGRPTDYRLLQANPAVQKLTGFDCTEAIGKTGSELSFGWTDDLLRKFYDVAITGTPYQYTRYNPRFSQHFEARVFSPRKGQFALLFNDISEQKQNEARLVAAIEAAEVAEQAKSHFLTTVAHEFRTPLGLLAVNTGILKNYGSRITPAEMESQLEEINQSVARLSHLVESVLAFNRSGAEDMIVTPVTINICATCTELAAGIKALFGDSHHLKVQVAAACGSMRLDEQLFRQIVENLLVNAFRYTPEGGQITLEVGISEKHLIIAVRDNGIGIPEEDQPHIFKPFYQAGTTGNRRGLGLGLSIVQQSVAMMGGVVSLKSRLGSGTVITIQLPLDDTLPLERESACTPS
jgi:PAS domain S-box-containing protein